MKTNSTQSLKPAPAEQKMDINNNLPQNTDNPCIANFIESLVAYEIASVHTLTNCKITFWSAAKACGEELTHPDCAAAVGTVPMSIP